MLSLRIPPAHLGTLLRRRTFVRLRFVVIWLCLSAAVATAASPSAGPLAGRRLALLLADDFNAVEAFYPWLRLREAGAEIVLVGEEKGRVYQGRGRYPLTSEAAVADLVAGDFDGVIIPGGDAPKRLRESAAMLAFVRAMAANDRWIAAVCHGPQLLGAAGLLDQRRITAWPDLRAEMENHGAVWVSSVVVVDGRLITSADPWTIDQFTAEIIHRLGRQEGEGRP